MTRSEAVTAVITLNGGIRHGSNAKGLPSFRFPSLNAADHCKDILDAMLPSGATGAVFFDGRILVDLTFIDAQGKEMQDA